MMLMSLCFTSSFLALGEGADALALNSRRKKEMEGSVQPTGAWRLVPTFHPQRVPQHDWCGGLWTPSPPPATLTR